MFDIMPIQIVWRYIMQERQNQYSRDALNNFLDFAGEKGLLKKTTGTARKAASSIVLGILDQNEASDLSKIDLESVIRRHRNRATGKISPTTLATYESRTRIAVKDFLEYVENPSAWKSSTRQRTSRGSAAASSVKKASERKDLGRPETTGQPSVHIDFQIHISPEASPDQIDQIFASMKRHLYGSTASE
jgi:hypothetical protein